MKALVYTAPLQFQMLDLPDPSSKPGEVLVRIRAAGAAGGAGVCIGLEEEVGAVGTRPLVTREVDLKGSYAYTMADFAESISLLERKLLPWKKVETIAQLVHGRAIFDDLASGSSAIMKAVFQV
jgi:threonine dehydrogenase-like Zn-dependent dehydrogenase